MLPKVICRTTRIYSKQHLRVAEMNFYPIKQEKLYKTGPDKYENCCTCTILCFTKNPPMTKFGLAYIITSLYKLLGYTYILI